MYLDGSAAAKLLLEETESTAMDAFMRDHAADAVSNDLLRTELYRAVRRGAPALAPRVTELLGSLDLLAVTRSTFERAARMDPASLRTLDAIHLASALELGDELKGIVTYDSRMSDAATSMGMPVVSPA